jgi:Na+/pantothenate symporter
MIKRPLLLWAWALFGVPTAYGLAVFFVAMALDKFPNSIFPIIAGVAALVLCIFSGLKALHVVYAGASRMLKIIFAIAYSGGMYVFCMVVGFFAMFAYGGCGGCS